MSERNSLSTDPGEVPGCRPKLFPAHGKEDHATLRPTPVFPARVTSLVPSQAPLEWRRTPLPQLFGRKEEQNGSLRHGHFVSVLAQSLRPQLAPAPVSTRLEITDYGSLPCGVVRTSTALHFAETASSFCARAPCRGTRSGAIRTSRFCGFLHSRWTFKLPPVCPLLMSLFSFV
jgi:hypothetical protein